MLLPCDCGRGQYDPEKFATCYECFQDRRADYATCVWCGAWHNPKFATCFTCRQVPERDEAGRDLKLVILARDGFACRYCHESGAFLNIDHIKPCASGGTAEPWNLQTLCAGCNRAKGATWWAGCKHDKVRQELMEIYYTRLWVYLTAEEQELLHAEMADLMLIRQEGEPVFERRPLTGRQISRLIALEEARADATRDPLKLRRPR